MTVLGIDFGTTTMAAARRYGARAELLKDKLGLHLFPSVVAYTPSGRVEVGANAKARRIIDPTNTLYSVKRILGKTWLSTEVTKYRRSYPFEIARSADNLPRFITRIGTLTATEAVSHMLTYIKKIAPSGSYDRVCLTVPPSFDEDQRRAASAAASRAGFAGCTLLEEPYAAALAYAQELLGDNRVAVYDFGGGTFDLAVLRLTGKHVELLATGGEAYLGGDDIDQQLAQWAAETILQSYRWDVRTSSNSFQALVFACERAKIRLSETHDTAVPLGQIDQVLEGKHILMERTQVDKLCASLVQRTFVLCDDVLRRARLHAHDVDAVILAGGGSHMPIVQRTVEQYFGTRPLMSLPPDEIVALGAAHFEP